MNKQPSNQPSRACYSECDKADYWQPRKASPVLNKMAYDESDEEPTEPTEPDEYDWETDLDGDDDCDEEEDEGDWED